MRYTIFRIIAGLVSFGFLTPFALKTFIHQVLHGCDLIGISLGLVVATFAILCGWFAIRGHVRESRDRMGFAFACGMAVFVIGFAVGFLDRPFSFRMPIRGRY